MIPYDDLVAALQAWRARQGLPVATPAAGRQETVGSGPTARPGTPPPVAAAATRPAPPPAPPSRQQAAAPAPAGDDHETLHEHEIDEQHEMIEEQHYENEGDDFAMSFAQDGHNGHVSGVDGADGSETMIGHDPAAHDPDRPSDLTDPGAAQRNGRDDW